MVAIAINMNINDDIKKQVDELFSKLGMTIYATINLFIHKLIYKIKKTDCHLKKTIDDYKNNRIFYEHELMEF